MDSQLDLSHPQVAVVADRQGPALLTDTHRNEGRRGVAAARRALATLRRPCRGHDWRAHPTGIVCRRCRRVLTADDDDTKKAAALTRLHQLDRPLAIAARTKLFPHQGESP